MRGGLLGLALALLLGGCAGKPHETFVASQLSWEAEREVSLSNPDNYLGLVALLWVEDGDSTIGSAEDADLRFDPAYAPPSLGVLEVADGQVTFVPATGVAVQVVGVDFDDVSDRIELIPDAQGTPTRVQVGELIFWIVDRGGRLAVRARHPESAVLEAYRGTDRFTPDVDWQVVARWQPYESPRAIQQPNILGSTYADAAVGELHFELQGTACVLEPTGDPDSLFLIFGDETNGDVTYGGGRFLRVPVPDDDGLLVIDFNRAYNPPCAYTEFTTCPLPLPRNRLAVPVTAGEKAPH